MLDQTLSDVLVFSDIIVATYFRMDGLLSGSDMCTAACFSSTRRTMTTPRCAPKSVLQRLSDGFHDVSGSAFRIEGVAVINSN